MPYTKHPFRSAKKFVVRKVKQRYSTKSGGLRVSRLVKDVAAIKNVLNPEKKFKDSQVITAATNLYPDDPFVSHFNLVNIAKGDNMDNRNGNSIKLSSIHLTMKISHNGVASHVKTNYRIYLIQFKGLQPASSRALVCDRMFERSPLDGTRTDFTSHRNIEQMHDIKIIASCKGSISSEQNLGYNESKTVTIHRKFTKHVRWDSANAIQEGEIYIVGIADRGTDASNDGLIIHGYNTRVYWYDN